MGRTPPSGGMPHAATAVGAKQVFLACVVAKPDAEPTLDSVRAHLEQRGFAKWQLPDWMELIDEVPRKASASSTRSPAREIR